MSTMLDVADLPRKLISPTHIWETKTETQQKLCTPPTRLDWGSMLKYKLKPMAQPLQACALDGEAMPSHKGMGHIRNNVLVAWDPSSSCRVNFRGRALGENWD